MMHIHELRINVQLRQQQLQQEARTLQLLRQSAQGSVGEALKKVLGHLVQPKPKALVWGPRGGMP